MASVAEKVYDLVKDTVESCGVSLWDVRFVKEGASHYLRIFIDKPEGVSINPIDCSYYLEVCSPGTERELSRPHHFEYGLGKNVTVKLFKAVDGKKEFTGVLKSADGDIIIDTENGEITFSKGSFSKIFITENF